MSHEMVALLEQGAVAAHEETVAALTAMGMDGRRNRALADLVRDQKMILYSALARVETVEELDYVWTGAAVAVLTHLLTQPQILVPDPERVLDRVLASARDVQRKVEAAR